MARDMSLVVMVYESEHVLPLAKETGRVTRGDIISYYESQNIAAFSGGDYANREPIGSNRLGIIHCIGVPDNVADMFEVLTLGDDANRLNKRYYFDPYLIPIPVGYEVLTNGESTVLWDSAVSYIRDKVTGQIITNDDILDYD